MRDRAAYRAAYWYVTIEHVIYLLRTILREISNNSDPRGDRSSKSFLKTTRVKLGPLAFLGI